jgi:hypothetical protein
MGRTELRGRLRRAATILALSALPAFHAVNHTVFSPLTRSLVLAAAA